MNTIKSLRTGAAIALAASSFFSCKPGNDKVSTSTDTAPAAVKTGELIVYVNSDSLLNNYEYFKDVKASIEEKSQRAQADLTAKGNAFQQEVNTYKQAVQTMSADQRQQTEARLARKQSELQNLNQNASSALASESSAENEKLYDKVAKYLKGYSKEKGYKLVLTYTKANPTVLFADESLDITKDVIKGLNEEYKKEKP